MNPHKASALLHSIGGIMEPTDDEKRAYAALETLYGKLTEREWKEVCFAMAYSQSFAHGTDDHVRLMLISKLVELYCEAAIGNA